MSPFQKPGAPVRADHLAASMRDARHQAESSIALSSIELREGLEVIEFFDTLPAELFSLA